MNWQPIETAPKDGTDILICDMTAQTPRCDLVHWNQGWIGCSSTTLEYIGTYLSASVGFYMPTHWMPLPEPPKDGEIK